MGAEALTMEQFRQPVEWKVTTTSGGQWLIMASSFTQAVVLVKELATEKVAFCQRVSDW
jgi:hypothetical protein